MTALDEIRAGWDQAAREDAMFNILTIPGKQGCWEPDEFFQRGRDEIAHVIERLNRFGLRGESRQRALDFGCGVGRLTKALAEHYGVAYGVDVSSEMVARAKEYAKPNGKRIRFRVNDKPDLSLFPDQHFDLIYSLITLQHMPNELQKGYVQEFIRLLAPDGLAVFQLPEGPEYHHPNAWLSMFTAPTETVIRWVEQAGGKVVDIELSAASGGGYDGWRYTARRA